MIRTHRLSLATAMLASTAMIVPFAGKATGESEAPPAPPEPASAAVGTIGDIESGIPLPTKTSGRGGGPSPYKDRIDRLEVGQSFHIAGKTKKSLNSTMHTFNKAYRVNELDASGNPVTEVKVGKKKDGTETRKTVNKYTEARKFQHYDVDATDPKGVGVRIFRIR